MKHEIPDETCLKLYQAGVSPEQLSMKTPVELCATVAYYAERTKHWMLLARGLGYEYESCEKDAEIKRKAYS